MKTSDQLTFNFSPQETCSFDNFLVTPENQELFALLQASDAVSAQHVFIWGSGGCGKSHLLQALCRRVPESVYLPMHKVGDYGPDSLSSLHYMDLVCVDDIDSVAGNRDWEEGLFGLFNRVRQAGNRLVVSATETLKGIAFVLPDLASRLAWGVTYHLHELRDEEKLQALSAHARARSMPLDEDVLQYIYRRYPRDLQSLIGVLNSLDRLSLAEKRRLTIPFVKEMMSW